MSAKESDRSSSAGSAGMLAVVATAVRERRKGLGLTQRALAELASCSTRFVVQLEGGKGTVRLDKTAAVLAALGLELRVERRRVP